MNYSCLILNLLKNEKWGIVSNKELAIGFFDSGFGGLSVLREALTILPDEKYIYFGDSLHAPYGTKSAWEVHSLTLQGAKYLLDKGIKALVLACNTATSVAVGDLRKKIDIPVIGMEPAIKPAANLANKNGKILLLATEMTLKEDKLKDLVKGLRLDDQLIKVAASQLVTLIERGAITRTKAYNVVKKYLGSYDFNEIEAIVLGCTHFVFYKNIIAEVVGKDVKIIDGNQGTVRHLKNRLNNLGLLSAGNSSHKQVEYCNSDPNINSAYYEEILQKIDKATN